MKRFWTHLLEAMALGAIMPLAYCFPAPPGHGYHEAILAFLFPMLVIRRVLQGRNLGWAFLSFLTGLVSILYWVPGTIAVKGGLSFGLATLASAMFFAWEALGLVGVAFLARFMYRRCGAWGAGMGAGLGMLVWEVYCFHVYTFSLGAALGGLPWIARSAAFLTTRGFTVLLWGSAALTAAHLGKGSWRKAALVPAALCGFLLLLGGAWLLLPRGGERILDVVIIQPDFEPGVRDPGMEPAMWARTDAELKAAGLPRKDVATLVLWPESSVLGRDDRGPNLRLQEEAKRRGVAWLFGTEGGLLNLVRGEAAGQLSFTQAKALPMAFGERMPGPEWMRKWLDAQLGFYSQLPGHLDGHSSFTFPTPQGPLKVHPLICSEALECDRVQEGLALAGGALLTNHTNDGWFERSIATDLHGVQIRLRSVESGLPLVRATLTGKSGYFRENGNWVLWGEARSEGAYAFTLRWRPIHTPARSPHLTSVLFGCLAGGMLLVAFRCKANA